MAIHCAVASIPGPEANEVLEYLMQACPAYLEKKTPDGETPLMVACKLGRVEFVEILIKAGADQTTRSLRGQNIVHTALEGATQVWPLRALLSLLDSDLLKHFFFQRQNLGEDGTTPLHGWIMGHSRFEPRSSVAIVNLILEHSEGGELEMLNSAGDTCLHTVIHNKSIHLIKLLIDFNPRLLYRENAVGRTPAELAHDALTDQMFSTPPSGPISRPSDVLDDVEEMQALTGLSGTYHADELENILSAMGLGSPSEHWGFIKEERAVHVIWDLCKTAMSKNPGKRRLVSLNEANDVARRLGESHQASRYFSVSGRRDHDDDDEAQSDGEYEENKRTDATDFVISRIREAQAWILPESEEDSEDSGED